MGVIVGAPVGAEVGKGVGFFDVGDFDGFSVGGRVGEREGCLNICKLYSEQQKGQHWWNKKIVIPSDFGILLTFIVGYNVGPFVGLTVG